MVEFKLLQDSNTSMQILRLKLGGEALLAVANPAWKLLMYIPTWTQGRQYCLSYRSSNFVTLLYVPDMFTKISKNREGAELFVFSFLILWQTYCGILSGMPIHAQSHRQHRQSAQEEEPQDSPLDPRSLHTFMVNQKRTNRPLWNVLESSTNFTLRNCLYSLNSPIEYRAVPHKAMKGHIWVGTE